MYGDDRVSIGRAANGYVVRMRDPKIEAANRKRSTKIDYDKPYVDPEKQYVFTDIAAVMTFLTANLDKALPKVDYESSFDLASSEAEDTD